MASGYWPAAYWPDGYWPDWYWGDTPGDVVRSVIPRACRRVVVDLGSTRRQAEPTEARVQPST